MLDVKERLSSTRPNFLLLTQSLKLPLDIAFYFFIMSVYSIKGTTVARAKSEDKRNAILEAAVNVFAERDHVDAVSSSIYAMHICAFGCVGRSVR